MSLKSNRGWLVQRTAIRASQALAERFGVSRNAIWKAMNNFSKPRATP